LNWHFPKTNWRGGIPYATINPSPEVVKAYLLRDNAERLLDRLRRPGMKDDRPLKSASNSGAAAPEFFHDHHALNEVLRRMLTTRDLNLLIPLLRELNQLLKDHFAREEESDGLYQVVNDAAPQHLEQVQKLLSEHGGFLATVSSLEEKAKACIDKPQDEIFSEIALLCQNLEMHEAMENDILTDALYRDLGESG
jgi:hypothetical protein